MPDDDGVAFQLKGENISDGAYAETSRDPRGKVAPLRGCAEDRRPIAAGLEAISGGCCRNFRIVIRERVVLDRCDYVGAVLAELGGFGGNPRRTENDRVHFSAAGFIRQHTRRGDGFEASLSQLAAAGFYKRKYIRH
jgi:hypothetical protein